MMKKRKAVRLLYKSLDKTLSAKEEAYLQKAFSKFDGLENEISELLILRQRLGKSSSGFRPFFSDRVISRVKQQRRQIAKQYFFDSLTTRFYRVAVAAAVAILVLISFNVLKTQNSSASETVVSSSRDLDEVLVPAFTTSLEDFYED
jgi:hypothetical protein